ncbi:Isochorismatase hydrolase [Aduncisulcus paluster]|uniref:Isochorismatase hydrolase n=1 Tax=Aduncisulcus paluster TaxID=2918883 RepID=A0ABQ5JT55_9EUKA|nr:Isochorismatase hydrolase [Aduncisulcus paluster]
MPILILCDIQSAFKDLMPAFGSMLKVADLSLKAASIAKWPVIVTEQAPKKLGGTVKELTLPEDVHLFPKTKFSCVTDDSEPLFDELLKTEKQVAIVGLETHICVKQTARDLSKKGFKVSILADGVCSQRQFDRIYAFESMRHMPNVDVTTFESFIFEQLEDAKNPNFRGLSRLVRETRPDPQLL